MKLNNKGFTLVELIVVVVVMGVLVSIASVAVINSLQKQKEKIQEESKKQLLDAAVSYALSENYYFKTCSVATDSSYSSVKSTCGTNNYTEITVQELITKGMFEDESDACKKETSILIYMNEHYNFQAKLSDEEVCVK